MKPEFAMLKVYLEDRVKAIESGEKSVHGPEYDKGVQYAYEWVLMLLNEPVTLKTYYDKAVNDEA